MAILIFLEVRHAGPLLAWFDSFTRREIRSPDKQTQIITMGKMIIKFLDTPPPTAGILSNMGNRQVLDSRSSPKSAKKASVSLFAIAVLYRA